MPKDFDREQERRDTVTELGVLSKCLAGYLGCFDDNKTHLQTDSELIKLMEWGLKDALRRLSGAQAAPEPDPLIEGTKVVMASYCTSREAPQLKPETMVQLNAEMQAMRNLVPSDDPPACLHDLIVDVRARYNCLELAEQRLENKSIAERPFFAITEPLLELAAAALLVYEEALILDSNLATSRRPGKKTK